MAASLDSLMDASVCHFILLQSEPGGCLDPNPPWQFIILPVLSIRGQQCFIFQRSHLLHPSAASPFKLPEPWRISITLSNFLLHKQAVRCNKCQDGVLCTKYETLNCPQSENLCLLPNNSLMCVPVSRHCGS